MTFFFIIGMGNDLNKKTVVAAYKCYNFIHRFLVKKGLQKLPEGGRNAPSKTHVSIWQLLFGSCIFASQFTLEFA